MKAWDSGLVLPFALLLAPLPAAAAGGALFDAPFRVVLPSTYGIAVRFEIWDMNGDGKQDIVAASGNDVTIQLGAGDGTFERWKGFDAGASTFGLAVGDLNGDAVPDVAAVDSYNSVSVLLGNGDGTLAPYHRFPVGGGPLSVAIGDVNGDGRPDVLTANTYGHSASVLIGNGDGTFVGGATIALTGAPYFVALGDLNGDGKLDLAAANGPSSATVSVALGNGDGTFQPRIDLLVGGGTVSLAISDVNGDRNPDLVAPNYPAGTVSVLLGNGEGGFASHVDYEAGPGPQNVDTGDLNRDGKVDLLVVNLNGSRTVSALLGNGDGTFGAPRGSGPRVGAYWAAAADVNSDGVPDAVAAHQGAMSVLLGNGDGTFGHAPRNYAVGGEAPYAMAAGDLDADGKADLVTADFGGGGVSVLKGIGDGSFEPRVDYPTGAFSLAVAIADWNADGTPDLATANNQAHSISLFPGRGDGTFGTRQDIIVPVVGEAIALAIADLNADAIPDLAVVIQDQKLVVLFGMGGGAFGPPTDYPIPDRPQSVEIADLNADGIPDLVTGNSGASAHGSVSVLLGTGNGTFAAPNDYLAEVSGWGYAMSAVADLNGDGALDVVMGNDATVSVLLGKGDGTLGPSREFETGQSALRLAVGDVNRDGIPDLVTAFDSLGCWVLLGNGDGTFDLPSGYGVDGSAGSVAIADLNGDRMPDLAVPNQGGDNLPMVTVLLNTLPSASPDCSRALAVPSVIGRRDHQFVPIQVEGISDPDGDPLAIAVTRVTQDEPVVAQPGQCPDATIDARGGAAVRAESSAHGNGRVYTIWFTAADGQGDSCEGSVQVCVPHDRRHPDCTDDGQAFVSLGPCPPGSPTSSSSPRSSRR